jgi:ubiquinone/menaquinone biosynthesis C-methylase UbiE
MRVNNVGMGLMSKKESRLFDEWPDQYDRWFETPLGKVVKACEQDLIMELLTPIEGETMLDAGCGTGMFTHDFLFSGASVVGLDLSLPMLRKAVRRYHLLPFRPIVGDMTRLPFKDESFDKTVSITALEFIEDVKGAVMELFRVTKTGGTVVVATLNSLSPWARQRRDEATRRETIFSKAFFRSPEEILALVSFPGTAKTVVHFPKDAEPEMALLREGEGRKKALDTGAFVAARWLKP